MYNENKMHVKKVSLLWSNKRNPANISCSESLIVTLEKLKNMFRINNKDTTIIFIIFWDFSMFYQIFLSPQVKRCPIITYKRGIYKLPHELPNDLRLRDLRKLGI